MKELNLLKILKGHEGETFYSPTFGNSKLNCISDVLYFKSINAKLSFNVYSDGTYCEDGEICIFPSKDQRDWDKWFEEQKPKVPKTWSDIIKANEVPNIMAGINWPDYVEGTTNNNTPIEKSALALLKIYQLIEVGYGGNVTYERCASVKYPDVFKITPTGLNGTLALTVKEVEVESNQNHIMFHKLEQAEEFLKYPENIQLVKDYFMI